ncbi:hypothetical protein DAPPUDRAFT_122769, partial [Daphnia pulex]
AMGEANFRLPLLFCIVILMYSMWWCCGDTFSLVIIALVSSQNFPPIVSYRDGVSQQGNPLPDHHLIGSVVEMMVVTVQIALDTDYWTRYNLFAILGSLLLYCVHKCSYNLVIGVSYVTKAMGEANFRLPLLFCIVILMYSMWWCCGDTFSLVIIALVSSQNFPPIVSYRDGVSQQENPLPDHHLIGSVVEMMVVTVQIALDTDYWTRYNLFAILGSLLLYCVHKCSYNLVIGVSYVTKIFFLAVRSLIP